MKDQNQRGKRLFSVFFLVFLLVFAAANVALHGQNVWQELTEIRWTWQDSKRALREAETALNEELLLRYPMIDTYGALQMAMGKREINAFEVVRDKNGFLYGGNFWNDFSDDAKELAIRTSRLAEQVEELGAQFGFVMFPSKVPEDAAKYTGVPYADFSYQAEKFCAWADYYGIPLLDLQNNWREAGLTQEEAFFKTDHHWTPLAAFHGYCEILHWLENEYRAEIPDMERLCSLEEYHQITYNKLMNGSQGRKTGPLFAGGLEPYTLIYPKEKGEYRLDVNGQTYEGTFADALLHLDYDVDSYRDFYQGEAERTYLHATVSYHVAIKNKGGPLKQRILLLRDSFATPVGAFLAQTFQKVDMFWITEYTQEDLDEILRQGHYDYVILALYPENLLLSSFNFGMSPDEIE